MKEIAHLRRWNTAGRVRFVDIHSETCRREFPQLDPVKAMETLHGLMPDGRMITGFEVTVEAWERVGKGRWVRWLRWPGVRRLSPHAYRLFARQRHRLAMWLTGRQRCESDDCRNG
jgi:predicted DCC family thiol-disulfide oxidoreductase YuxK